MAQVVIENVSKCFTHSEEGVIPAVQNVNLEVAEGEFLVLVGPSGSGKSTLLRLIAGLEEVTSGTISIGGRVVNDVSPQDRDVAMVFQNYALYPHMTAYENIAFGLKLRKIPKVQIDRLVRETSAILGLTEHLHCLPMTLSGGQKQRVALGRAMVRKPKVFLLDEPLSNLDARMRVQMRIEISKLHKRLGSTMMFVTHDQIEAMSLGDRIAVLKEGTVQQVAGPMPLYEAPANLFVAGFIGSPPMNVFLGVLTERENEIWFQVESDDSSQPGDRLSLRLGPSARSLLAGHRANRIILGLRPEDIVAAGMLASSNFPGADVSVAEAVVEHVEPLGSETCVYSKAGRAQFVARAPADFRAAVNQRIQFGFNLCRAHYFDPVTEERIGP